MSNEKELEFKFRIHRIETLQFALIQEEVSAEKLAFSVSFGYGIDPQTSLVRSSFRYDLICDDKICLLIEVALDFEIDKDCFEKNFKQEGKIFIRKDFASHLSVIVVGTTRGILHEKTKGKPVNAYPIPAINVLSQIKEDIFFEGL